MREFIQQNGIFLMLALVFIVYVWMISASQKRQQKTDAYLSKAQSDTEEFKRHNAAVEAKLDRIIALLERPRED